jgi:hypothetical protein
MQGIRRTHGTAQGEPDPHQRPPPASSMARCSAQSIAMTGSPRVCPTDRAIALIVKQRAMAAGVDPTSYSAHSAAAHGRGTRYRPGRWTNHRPTTLATNMQLLFRCAL